MSVVIKALLLDLDGTVYLGNREVPGAAAFVRRMHAAGIRTLFVTNRSNRVPAEVCAQLWSYGIECGETDVLTSAQATALFLERGRVYCIGEAGLRQALEARGIELTDERPDVVVVGFDRAFDYERLCRAVRFIDAGARFVATNPDKVLRLTDGPVPGTGAILAAITAATGREPEVVGKPEPRIFEMALRQLGVPAAATVAVGDNLETDIAAGVSAGLRTALLLTGVSTRADLARSAFQPTWVAADYGELNERLAEDGGIS